MKKGRQIILKRERKEYIKWIPLDDMDFSWDIKDVDKVREAYKDNLHISKIAKIAKRPQDEVAVLIMDLGRKGLL